jgi:hypothetical protein
MEGAGDRGGREPCKCPNQVSETCRYNRKPPHLPLPESSNITNTICYEDYISVQPFDIPAKML